MVEENCIETSKNLNKLIKPLTFEVSRLEEKYGNILDRSQLQEFNKFSF